MLQVCFSSLMTRLSRTRNVMCDCHTCGSHSEQSNCGHLQSNLLQLLTITCHGGSLWAPWCVLVLLCQDLDVSPAKLQNVLAQLGAALMARLLHSVAQQHKSPRQAKYQQQHTQLLGHVPPLQEGTQHVTGVLTVGVGWAGNALSWQKSSLVVVLPLRMR